MGEGLLLELSWLDGSVSIVLPWRKVVLSLQLSAVRSSCRGKCFYLVSVFGSILVFIWSCKASRFSNIFDYYCEYSFLCGDDFLLFVLRYFVSGACMFFYYTCLLFVYLGCAGSVGVFWRAGSCTFCVM
jgi:hypothetical protein